MVINEECLLRSIDNVMLSSNTISPVLSALNAFKRVTSVAYNKSQTVCHVNLEDVFDAPRDENW